LIQENEYTWSKAGGIFVGEIGKRSGMEEALGSAGLE
jgi:hypothetical protein